MEFLNVNPGVTYNNHQICKRLGRWCVLIGHGVSIISELWKIQGRHSLPGSMWDWSTHTYHVRNSHSSFWQPKFNLTYRL